MVWYIENKVEKKFKDMEFFLGAIRVDSVRRCCILEL